MSSWGQRHVWCLRQKLRVPLLVVEDVPPLAVWRLWNDIGGASHLGVPPTSSYQFGGELWWPLQKTQACLRMQVHVQCQVRGLEREVLGSSTSWCPLPVGLWGSLPSCCAHHLSPGPREGFLLVLSSFPGRGRGSGLPGWTQDSS